MIIHYFLYFYAIALSFAISSINKIIEKYGFEEKRAIKEYFQSETYKMLLDKETGVYTMSPLIVFDMWEAEKICGNPRKSQYIR